MKIERNKIIEATEAELMERYLKEWYDDIYSFREYLRLMVEAGVKIVEMKQVPEWEACVNAIEQAQKEAYNQALEDAAENVIMKLLNGIIVIDKDSILKLKK